jgi:hypothetical protein
MLFYPHCLRRKFPVALSCQKSELRGINFFLSVSISNTQDVLDLPSLHTFCQMLTRVKYLQVTTTLLFKLIPAVMHLGVLLRWFPPDSAVEVSIEDGIV